jgi:PST family polysaccharide transporter
VIESPPRPAQRGEHGAAIRAVAWVSLGTGIQSIAQLVGTIALARLLTPADFGVVGAATSIVGIGLVAICGVAPSVIQRQHLEIAFVRTAFTVVALAGAVLTGIIWLAAPLVADWFHQPALESVLRWLSCAVVLQGVSAVADSLLQRNLQFRALATIETTAVLVGFVGTGIAMALLGFGIWSLVGAHIVQNVVRSGLLIAIAAHTKRPLFDRAQGGALLRLTFGFTLGRVGGYIAANCDDLVIGRCLGASALGLYGRAGQFTSTPASLGGYIIGRVLFPALARVASRPVELRSAFRLCLSLATIVAFPITAVVAVLGPDLLVLLAGPSWKDAVWPMRVLAFGMCWEIASRVGDALLRAVAVYRRARQQAIYALLAVVFTLATVRWGLQAVAAAVVAAALINYLLSAKLALSVTGMGWRSFAWTHAGGIVLAAYVGLLSHAAMIGARAMGVGTGAALLAGFAGATIGALVPLWSPRLLPRVVGEDLRSARRLLEDDSPPGELL